MLYEAKVSKKGAMAILNSCCCWRSIRRACYACAVYTLIYYTLFAITLWQNVFQILQSQLGIAIEDSSILMPNPGDMSKVMQYMIFILTAACSFGPLACLILIYGIWKNKKFPFLPWIIDTHFIILFETIFVGYLAYGKRNSPDPAVAMIITIDFFSLVLTSYALLCVISQLQEIYAGRGMAPNSASLPTGSSVRTLDVEGNRRPNVYEAKTNGISPGPGKKSFRGASRGPSIKISRVDEMMKKDELLTSISHQGNPLLCGSSSSQYSRRAGMESGTNRGDLLHQSSIHNERGNQDPFAVQESQNSRSTQDESETDVTTEGDSTAGRENTSESNLHHSVPLIRAQSLPDDTDV